MPILPAAAVEFDAEAPIVIIGAGACGLVAALAAADARAVGAGSDPGAGSGIIVLERDAVPQGSTALSSGLIPAAGTRIQKEQGLDDSVARMRDDIIAKAHGENDATMVEATCRQSAITIDWLNDTHGLQLSVIDSFLYPGHSTYRMHGTPSKTGRELVAALNRRAEEHGITIVTDAHATDLFVGSDADAADAAAGGVVRGVRYVRPDGSAETLGCAALILACNGYGGNRAMVAEFMPEMKNALYFGHDGNQGDAVSWGRELGADMADLGSYQGHGSVAHPHGILVSWALMMEGGIQVNTEGRRFSNEHDGYSEQARRVIAQPGGIAWNIYDRRLHEFALDFDDYRQAEEAGAIRRADTAAKLAKTCDLPVEAVCETLGAVDALAAAGSKDEFGRSFAKPRLAPPYYAVRVTGALFHTQGGLVVDAHARVLREDGTPFVNLFAGGGAARGLSGSSDWGYLSGNGLLTAVTLGHLAGTQAAILVLEPVLEPVSEPVLEKTPHDSKWHNSRSTD